MLVAANMQGIGNRIKCMWGAARLDSEFKVKWVNTSWVGKNTNSGFLDLFDMSDRYVAEIPSAGQEYRCYQLAEKPTDRKLYVLPEKRKGHGGYLDHGYETIPHQVIADYMNVKKFIVPRQHIIDKADKFYDQYMDKDIIGIQIRSWGECSNPSAYCHGRYANFDILKFVERMSYYNGKFFVSTDDPKLTLELQRLFPSRILTLDFEHDGNIFTGIRNDMTTWLCDLLLLSKCNKMLVSVDSTFGEAAWWWGGATAHVDVIGHETPFTG